MRNLKQGHNDHIIISVVKKELSVPDLLKMSIQQFADTTTQQLRELQHTKYLEEIEENSKRSMTDEIEARRRHTNIGQAEAWRQGTNTSIDMTKALVEESTKPINDQIMTMLSNPSLDNQTPIVDNNLDSLKKFPGYVDKTIRLVSSSSKPNRTANEELDIEKKDQLDMKNRENTSYANTSITIEKSNAPKVIDLLKLSKVKEDLKDAADESSTDVNIPMRLVCSDGQRNFILQRPGGNPIECSAVLTDKRVQGLLLNNMIIGGRSRISDLERYISETTLANKKIVATCKIFVHNDRTSSESGYLKFCSEFTTDRRAGVVNTIENSSSTNLSNLSIQFYIIPPELKEAITILRSIDGSDTHHTLYGIIISKAAGPPKYVNSKPEFYSNTDQMVSSPERVVDDDILTSTIPPTSSPRTNANTNANTNLNKGITIPNIINTLPIKPTNQQLNLGNQMANSLAMNSSRNLSMLLGNASKTMSLSNKFSINTIPNINTNINKPNNIQKPFDDWDLTNQLNIIKNCAKYCVSNGPTSVDNLRAKEGAELYTPFLFEDHNRYNEFQNILKDLLGFK
eukprot:gene17358-22905_t